jgi:hypothetical protein
VSGHAEATILAPGGGWMQRNMNWEVIINFYYRGRCRLSGIFWRIYFLRIVLLHRISAHYDNSVAHQILTAASDGLTMVVIHVNHHRGRMCCQNKRICMFWLHSVRKHTVELYIDYALHINIARYDQKHVHELQIDLFCLQDVRNLIRGNKIFI